MIALIRKYVARVSRRIAAHAAAAAGPRGFTRHFAQSSLGHFIYGETIVLFGQSTQTLI